MGETEKEEKKDMGEFICELILKSRGKKLSEAQAKEKANSQSTEGRPLAPTGLDLLKSLNPSVCQEYFPPVAMEIDIKLLLSWPKRLTDLKVDNILQVAALMCNKTHTCHT